MQCRAVPCSAVPCCAVPCHPHMHAAKWAMVCHGMVNKNLFCVVLSGGGGVGCFGLIPRKERPLMPPQRNQSRGHQQRAAVHCTQHPCCCVPTTASRPHTTTELPPHQHHHHNLAANHIPTHPTSTTPPTTHSSTAHNKKRRQASNNKKKPPCKEKYFLRESNRAVVQTSNGPAY